MSKLIKFKLQEDQYLSPYHHFVDFDKKKSYQFLYWGIEYYGYVSFILKLISKVRKKTNIAEVGCGDGKISLEIAKMLPSSSVEGYDLAGQAIQFAKSYSYHLPNCSFHEKDFKNSDKKYDLILAVEVLEHIPDNEINSFCNTISKKLNNDGNFIISVPSTNLPLNKKHYRHYNIEILKRQIGNDFVIKEYFYVHNENSLLYKFIRSLLINRLFILNVNSIRKFLFNYYKNNLIDANINTGSHLIAVCTKKLK